MASEIDRNDSDSVLGQRACQRAYGGAVASVAMQEHYYGWAFCRGWRKWQTSKTAWLAWNVNGRRNAAVESRIEMGWTQVLKISKSPRRGQKQQDHNRAQYSPGIAHFGD
jgi:hypothetical protein